MKTLHKQEASEGKIHSHREEEAGVLGPVRGVRWMAGIREHFTKPQSSQRTFGVHHRFWQTSVSVADTEAASGLGVPCRAVDV